MMQHELPAVAVVDDNRLLRQHLVTRLQGNYRVVFEADSGITMQHCLLSNLEQDLPLAILMDIEMDDMDGIEATRWVKANFASTKVIMLTVMDDEERVWQSIVAGADSYILKDEPREKLLACIHDTLDGGAYMSPGIARKAMKLMQQQAALPHLDAQSQMAELTRRELEILQLLQEGLTYKQIADRIYISAHTAKTHIHNIYEKLQVRNKVEASNKLKQFVRPRV
jgi:DNA-binding NarL/FixJ family response regulator